MVCCFFFKQKTAYEMRISDWSSDVCSSDLPMALIESFVHGIGVVVARHPWLPPLWVREVLCEGGALREVLFAEGVPGDRKSVVSGKSVSVRVDLGGRRIIKKKRTRQLT